MSSSFDINTATYKQKSSYAASVYGTADVRPQDLDRSLMKNALKTNLELPNPFPPNYQADLFAWLNSFKTSLQVPLFSSNVIFPAYTNKELESALTKTDVKNVGVLAVDFEFHKDYSYDGKCMESTIAIVIIMLLAY